MAIHPYLFFSGNCREAFTRYHAILGGDLEVMTNADAPDGQGMPGAAGDVVLHASLTRGDDVLMASDDPSGDGGPVKGFTVSLGVAGADEARRVFDALAEGGEVTMPLEATFWSPLFGMCTDRFGIPWMVGVEAPADAS